MSVAPKDSRAKMPRCLHEDYNACTKQVYISIFGSVERVRRILPIIDIRVAHYGWIRTIRWLLPKE